MRGTPGSPPPDPHSFLLSRFPCHPSPPLCLLFSSFSTSSILSHCFTPPPWLLMGVRPPEYPASPSLSNTYPLGNASTLVPGSFSVNTSLFLVCAKYLLTSVSLFRSLKQESGAGRDKRASGESQRSARQHAPWVVAVFVSRACYTCALIKHVAERCSVVVVVETPEMFSDRFNKVLCRKYARKM